MNTSLSTARMRVSSARETPMPAPISEPFHGTMTSDFGASWLPRIDMPRAFDSEAAACAFGAGAASERPSDRLGSRKHRMEDGIAAVVDLAATVDVLDAIERGRRRVPDPRWEVDTTDKSHRP